VRCLTPDECERWRDEHCHRREWREQTTCITPLKRLPWFTTELVQHLQPFDSALLIVDQVVFDVPRELEEIRRAAGGPWLVREAPGHLFENDSEGLRAALEVVLSDWIDLRVLVSPSGNAILADHDEYTTFFSESSGKIAEVRSVFNAAGVELVDWTAKAP
jgi:hypothetical protein